MLYSQSLRRKCVLRHISAARLGPAPFASRPQFRPPNHDTLLFSCRSRTENRTFSSSTPVRHGSLGQVRPGEERRVTFVDKEGGSHTFEVADGDNMLDVALEFGIDIEGACGGSCACSTCHIIVEKLYDDLPPASEDEDDMLDLAFGLSAQSRLACQIKMAKGLDGLQMRLPSMTRNMQASDFEKK